MLWEIATRAIPYHGLEPDDIQHGVVQRGLRPPIPPLCPRPWAELMEGWVPYVVARSDRVQLLGHVVADAALLSAAAGHSADVAGYIVYYCEAHVLSLVCTLMIHLLSLPQGRRRFNARQTS